MPKVSVGEPLSIQLNSGIETLYAYKGYIVSSCRKFLSHRTENIRMRTLWSFFLSFFSQSSKCSRSGTYRCLRNFRVSKKILDERRGSGHHDSPSKFLSDTIELFCEGFFLCFRKFPVSKILIDNREKREPTRFFGIYPCLTVPKPLIGEPFIVTIVLGIERFYALEGLPITIICRK